MKKIANFLKSHVLFSWIILIILLTIPSFITLLQPGYFNMHDDLEVMRIFEMDKCLRDGQLPCRWVPDMGYGYGYPLFNYYPVMPFYLGEIIHLTGFSLIWSAKILFMLSFLVSGVTMFFLSRKMWGNLGGAVSAIFYVYAPYHAVDIYVRGAMAESWSLALVPTVFLAITLVVEKSNLRNIALLAIFSALFLISHNPLVLIFTPIIVVWALILIIASKKYWSILKLGIGGIWGLFMAAFFLFPVLFEGKFVHLETLFEGYFNYLAHFATFNQMFLSTFWGYGGSVYGPNDGLSFQIGWLHSLAVILAVPLVIFLWKKDKMRSILLSLAIISFWSAAFMTHQKSSFIWLRLTILKDLQFPWRFLSIVIFTSSFAVGSFFVNWFRKQILVWIFLLLILTVTILYRPYFSIERVVPLTDSQKLSGALWDLQRTAGIFDYLPKTAKFPPAKGAKEEIEILSGIAYQNNFKRGTDWLSGDVVTTASAKLRLPIIDFPNWKVFVDGKEIKFNNKNDLGQPTFDIPSGHHKIFAKLYDTPVRTLSNILSLIAFLSLLIIIIKRLSEGYQPSAAKSKR